MTDESKADYFSFRKRPSLGYAAIFFSSVLFWWRFRFVTSFYFYLIGLERTEKKRWHQKRTRRLVRHCPTEFYWVLKLFFVAHLNRLVVGRFDQVKVRCRVFSLTFFFVATEMIFAEFRSRNRRVTESKRRTCLNKQQTGGPCSFVVLLFGFVFFCLSKVARALARNRRTFSISARLLFQRLTVRVDRQQVDPFK